MSYLNTTLKRNSKLDLCKSDLLKLVSLLEGELQAREIVIAILKSEQIKRLLNPSRLPLTSGFKLSNNINAHCSASTNDLAPEQTIKYSADPLSALARDSFAVYEPSLDHSTTLALFNLKMYQLENLLNNQKLLRNKFVEQLKTLESRYEKILNELEIERNKNKSLQSTCEAQDKNSLEEEVKTLTKSLEEVKDREKQMVLSLLSERKRLIVQLIEERHQNEEIRQVLSSEKAKIAEMVEGLEDESKRSLQMEAELEKYQVDFEQEKSNFKLQLQLSESKNIELTKEIEKLKSTIENIQKQLSNNNSNSKVINDNVVDSSKWNIGEGVRSAIVTVPVSSKVHSLSSVSTVSHPKASMAQPVTKSIPTTNTILPPPSIPVPQPKQGAAFIKKTMPAAVCKNPPIAAQSGGGTDNSKVDNGTTNVIDNKNSLQDSINSGESVCQPVCKQTPPTATTEVAAGSGKVDNSVRQNIMFYEKSANQAANKPSLPPPPPSNSSSSAQTVLAAATSAAVPPPPRKPSTSANARIPPPVPPNKPSIKPILPSQAILHHQTKLKDANSGHHLIVKSNSQNKTTATLNSSVQASSSSSNCNSKG